MTMAFSGMDKDERQGSGIEGAGVHWKKLSLGTLYRIIMLENVSVDVVDGARVKGVLGFSFVPGRTEGVNKGRVFHAITTHRS
jgi:hypothetical protein